MLSIILVAAGSGKRMQSNIPKQFIELNEKTILEHTLEAFLFLKDEKEFIIVLNKDYLEYGTRISQAFSGENIKIVAGGAERFHSVKNALSAVNPNCEIVLIHDGVRPFVTKEVTQRGIDCCKINGNAIPAIPLRDSIRELIDNKPSEHKNRSNFRLTQTPQVFDYQLVKKSYSTEYLVDFTDDASVIEHNGIEVTLFEGEESNIKITKKSDLEYAQFLLNKK